MRVIKFVILGIFLFGIFMIGVALFQGATFDELLSFGVDDRGYEAQVEHVFESKSDDVSLDLTDRHIIIHLVDEPSIRMTYHPHEKDTWTFEDELSGVSARQRRTAEFRLFSFGVASRHLREVHLYLPNDLTYTLDLKTTTGQIDLRFESTQTFQEVSLQSTTGRIRVDHIDVLDLLKLRATTGEIEMIQVRAKHIDGVLTTGESLLDGFESESFKWISTTGKTILKNGQLSQVLEATTTTGRISIIDVLAPSYDLTATTGDVIVSLESISHLYYDLATTTGNITISGVRMSKNYVTAPTLSQDVYIKVRVTTGDIQIKTIS